MNAIRNYLRGIVVKRGLAPSRPTRTASEAYDGEVPVPVLRRCHVRPVLFTGLLCLLAAGALAAEGQSLDVPPEKIPGDKPGAMMRRYWLRQAEQAFQRWQADYENRKTPEQIAAYQKRLREKFLEAIGGLPERTPLKPKVTGTVSRDGYRVEKVIFESQPKHFVTALLFLPDAERFKPPYPGVLVPCGHAHERQGPRRVPDDGRPAGAQRHGGAGLRPDRPGRARPVPRQGRLAEALGHSTATSLVGIGCILLGPQHGPLRDLGRHAGDRLSPVAARGRPASGSAAPATAAAARRPAT